MSTKIYNGYKIPLMSSYELGCFFEKLRAKLMVAYRIEVKKQVAKDVIKLFDEIWVEKIMKERYKETMQIKYDFEIEHKIVCVVFDVVRKKFKEIYNTMGRNPSYDFQCSISVIPIKDSTLCIVYTEKSVYEEIFSNIKGVEKYGYWDNTDSPEGLLNKEWKKRKITWKKALKNFNAPSQCGFTWELLREGYLEEFNTTIDKQLVEEILNYAKSFEDRVEKFAKNKIMQEKMQEYKEKNNIVKVVEISDSGYFYAHDFLRTEEGKVAIKNEIPNWKIKLKKEITAEDIMKPYEEILEESNLKNI